MPTKHRVISTMFNSCNIYKDKMWVESMSRIIHKLKLLRIELLAKFNYHCKDIES